ncbi:hypothetical protein PENTCL1PPCAC_9319 [Pristionchus entomophagus]|uniref:Arrestin C-terminal-like domain-containing protein n=1 Tax=Pristionchus entomophagus TaxID=358040 RepID=A0AAV5T3N7_9BILA|nr:hypothetical protein PENTCL1PPCAC_9319 [Pristionchus entomophagus]
MHQSAQPPYRCYIDTDKQAYYPGDKVTCNAELTFDRKFNCDEIIAVFTGEARAYWVDKQVSEKSLCRHKMFYQKKSLFEQKKTIWQADLIEIGKKKESSLADIVRFASPNTIRPGNLLPGEKKQQEFRGFEAGKHMLPVEFEIPEDGIHSSLEVDEELASIRYQIEILCLVDGRIAKKFHQLLHVFAHKDLSEDMDKLGRSASSQKSLHSKIGRLEAVLTLPKTGFTPGEPLNAHVSVHNMTSNSVKFASVSIVKKITAIANQPSYEFKEREDETAGSILPFPKIQRGERKEWIAQIHVPALTPNLCMEDLIHVNYDANISVGYERGKRKSAVLNIRIPITIGTVAIESSGADTLPVKAFEKIPLSSEDSSGAKMQLRQRVTLLNLAQSSTLPSAPPTYEEVMGRSPAYPSLDDSPLGYSER